MATTRGVSTTVWAAHWLLVMLMMTLMGSANAQANPRYAGIVVDLENGEVLYAENADEPRYPASLTKMMTLYLTFEALEEGRLSLDQPDTAIRALAVRSANDVAVVVAEALGGSEQRFANLMTAKARELGMNATRYVDALGAGDAGLSPVLPLFRFAGVHLPRYSPYQPQPIGA